MPTISGSGSQQPHGETLVGKRGGSWDCGDTTYHVKAENIATAIWVSLLRKLLVDYVRIWGSLAKSKRCRSWVEEE